MSDLFQRALDISRNRRALELITGTRGASLRKLSHDRRRELLRFIGLAPAEPEERDRYTYREKLYACIRLVQRGRGGMRAMALQEGLKVAGHTLTERYLGVRYGFWRPVSNENGGRRGDYQIRQDDEAAIDSALAAMIEASRVLRGGDRFYAEWVACDGIGGVDMSDHAPGLEQGECGRVSEYRPGTNERGGWAF